LETLEHAELKTALPLTIAQSTVKFPVVIDWSMTTVLRPTSLGAFNQ